MSILANYIPGLYIGSIGNKKLLSEKTGGKNMVKSQKQADTPPRREHILSRA